MNIYRSVVCLGIFAAVCLAGPQNAYAQQHVAEDKPYKQELAAVESKLRTGNIAGAIESLDQVIAKYPEAAEVHYAKALLFGQARNFEVAIPLAEKAFELEPKNLLFANYLVELHKGNGDLQGALPVVDKVIEAYPDNSSLYREKIMLLHANRQSEAALQTYDTTVSRFGKTDTLDVIKAEILVDLDRKEEAETTLMPWFRENSGIRQVYSTLGYLYLDKKNVKQAIQVLDRGLKNTNDNLLYLDLADAYTADKKDKLAFDALKKAFDATDVNYADKQRVMFTLLSGRSTFTLDQIQDLANTLVLKHPRIADSHVAKGDVLWRRGNLQEARSLFLTAIGINRNHVDAWRMLMNVELALNDADQAISHGFEALEANPNNPILLYFTGLAYMVKDDTDNARKMMETALDNSGHENNYLQSLIYAGLGDLYHKLKMVEVSDVAYEEAIKLDSTNATAMNNYAYYLSERNEKLELAEELSRKSNELDPASSTFQDTYAWVLFKQEKYKEALQWMEKAIKGANPSAVLYEHYGDILSKVGNRKEAVRQWEKALAASEGSGIDVEKLKTKITTRGYVE
ncbi:tetratricopeptide repeat protein [Sphingobacterium allocomposti]|uniref:Tetratricopeptide repeat protein n=1 Tax=Sphingobacterium allocomposti TaxID=415956 RepID=A0A5S5DKG5_9SPHI|nr:tetratricopeptide repeat protein [Sphingobacterium composti Yoo et al. 2007 non Ten et al. 2007]TYP96407.1 tetratricopeptide repeat protein [Sphingobacterium composti Yoo et al. 2007 non Ten et al. 2007]